MPKLGGIYVSVRARKDKYKRDLAEAKTLTKKAAIVMQHQISKITFAKVGASALAAGAVIAKMAFDGFRAMEKMKLSTASLASTITSFAKDADKDLSGTFLQALGYSEQLVLKMEELNAQTVATGENLTAMVETLAQGGVLLDINNEKQVKGFLAIANALALITQGQNADIQFRQEIRGLVQGEVRATNMLARLLSQRVGGSLKDNVKLWKEQGTLIESAGALLTGFQEGAKDLSNTWLAVGTTLSTMYNRTLRGLIAPVYEDIIQMGKEITLNVLDQNSTLNRNAVFLRTVVFKGWQDIKNITESIVDVIAAFKDPLLLIGGLLGVIIDGLGQIFAILPAITNRLKLMTQAIFDSVKWSMHLGEAFTALLTLDFKSAAAAWQASKDDWMESGRKTAEAFSGGFLDEIDERLAKFNKDLTIKAKPPVLPPGLKPPVLDEKELTKAAKDYQKLIAGLFEPIFKSEFERDEEMFKLLEEQEEKRLEIVKDFNDKYAELGLDRFDLERLQLEREIEIYKDAGVEKNRIDQMVAQKSSDIAKAEMNAKLDIYSQIAGGAADSFMKIAQAGGESSKKSFAAFKAFAMVQAGILGVQSVLQALASAPPPYSFVLAGVAGAAAAIQIAQIADAQPPSFDNGGISNARGVFQTGNIREAHVPIPSGKIPVQINGGQDQKPPEVNIFQTVNQSLFDQWAASSRGQNAIFNSVGSKPQRLKAIMRTAR